MVVPSLALGGAVGVLLSAGFIWWEVGRFAAPQVPTTVFDERKLLAGYTVGLFVGVPLAAAFLFLIASLANGALLGGAVFLFALVAGTELAQYLELRTRYWKGPPGPFYALALRAGIGGILALAVITTYLGGPGVSLAEVAVAAVDSVAVVALEVTGALVSLPAPGPAPRPRSRHFEGALFGAFGFFLVAFGPLAGPGGAVLGGAVALLGAVLTYRRRRPVLEDVPAPDAGPAAPAGEARPTYGRTTAENGSAPDRPLR